MIAEFRKHMANSPEFARFTPFAIFVVITFFGGTANGDLKFWLYALKVFVGAWLVWEMRSVVSEMRWAISWEAVIVGVAIFVIWVGLNPYYPMISLLFKDTPESVWNPFARFGEGSALAWTIMCIRIFGMTIVVPPLEEVFYRSLFYRYVIKFDFQAVALNHFDGVAFVLVSSVFGLLHPEWLAGIICGMAYQWLVIRKGRLGDAMTAHAITNFLLGVYVVWKGASDPSAWKFL